uniref:Bestrophin homolog n=1 Tax=Panagrolaimus sp. JU765 TaxID=591449 RepID=A0AC34RA79_9BILA
MTVTYSYEASTASFLGIHRLLLHWRASVWKAVWPELLLWCVCYTIISVCYRCAMNEHQQHTFERICNYAYGYSDYLPLSLILSFFVNTVYTRFTKFFDNLAFIDSPGLLVCASIKGTDETARNIRRNIVRYMVLMQALVMRKISSNIKRRFPTMDHLVTAGLMTENELKEFDSLVSPQMKYWVPIHWAFSLCRKARALGMIDSDFILIDVLDKIRGFRQPTLTLILLDWVPIPLVYTQVVNLTVRIFFILALLGRQYLLHGDTPNAKVIDLYVPIISIIQFILYIGWIKVAEVLLNPFGDDDDDFELNWVIDRNLQVGLLIADSYDRYPKLERDAFWNDVLPEPLYTAESDRPQNPMVGSVAELNVSPQKRKISDYFMPPKWRSEQNI